MSTRTRGRIQPGVISGALSGLLLSLAPHATCFGQMAASASVPIATPVQLAVRGRVTHPQRFTMAQLEKMPAVTVTVSQVARNGMLRSTYRGALLWTLLDRTGLIDAPGTKTHLQHTVLARGSDGYAVALAIAELDPEFEGKPVIVATEQDGRPFGGLKLIVPNDRRAGRDVRDLVLIEVR